MDKGVGEGATTGFWWKPERLNLTFFAVPIESFVFNYHFHLSEEADGSDVKSKLLVRVSKVIEHDVDNWNLINFGSVQLQHSLSVPVPCL